MVDKKSRGHKAVIKGLSFEKRIGEHLSQKGYKISYEKPVGKDRFDVFGVEEDFFGSESYCIVECKNKPRVTLADITRFRSKLRRFYESLPESLLINKAHVEAILAYTGELPKDAKEAVRDFKPAIRFKKF